MNEHPTHSTSEKNKKYKMMSSIAIIVLSLVAVAAVGYSVYAWQQTAGLKNDLSAKESQYKTLASENATLKKSAPTTKEEKKEQVVPPTEQELVRQAAQNYTDAQVLDTKYVVKVSKIKGEFASAGVAPAIEPTRSVMGLILKKANGSWVVIHEGQNPPEQNVITQFAIPKEFVS